MKVNKKRKYLSQNIYQESTYELAKYFRLQVSETKRKRRVYIFYWKLNHRYLKVQVLTIFNTIILVRSVIKFLDRHFLFIEKVQG